MMSADAEPPEFTEDGHYLIVNGRRWQATDPSIPEGLHKELVAELMSARRAVKTEPATARPRVQDAKLALGERGEPWWQPSAHGQQIRLAAAIRTLLRHRQPESTICPSDAARVVGGQGWRELMDSARVVAAELTEAGVIFVQQGGHEVDPASAVGPVRLARGPRWEQYSIS